MLAVVGCSSEQEPAAAGAQADAGTADQSSLIDSDAAQQAGCEAKNTGCIKAYWTTSGTCVLDVNLGAACGSGSSECRGICGADGQCVQPGPEKACGKGAPECSRCDGKGACSFFIPGAACKTSVLDPCKMGTGVCSGVGVCTGSVKVGGSCTAVNPGECVDDAGVCATDGSCQVVFKPKGTPCGLPYGKDCSDTCNGAGKCHSNAGADCAMKGGACGGQPGVCNTDGYCAASLPCGKAYFPQPCGDFALGKSCKKTYASPAYPQYCDSPSGYPTANSNSCGDAGDPCQPKMCSVDLSLPLTCTAGQMPDGAPCPGVAANPCSAAKCLSGKCQAAFKPAGTPCTPLAPKQCGAHECNAVGECAAVVPDVPLASSCTLSDGDTDCWVKSCDSAGTCTKIPRPAGEACGVVPDDACSAHRCDGKGWCVAQLTSETALCKHSDCLLPTATISSPCPVGPCVDSGCMKLGLCHTSYKKAGASCKIDTMPGTCDADHHCNLTGKGSQSVVGKLCIGQFPCMKEDVAYGEDGACHGTVAAGEICGTPCKPGICGADGTCQLALAPTGTTCGATDDCGKMECDGKGECGFPKAAVGANCGSPSWPQPAECEQYTCNVKGECATTAAVGKSCKTPSPCLVGTCTKYSKCGYDPISGPACDLATPDACNTGLCKLGNCEPVPKPGASCQSSGTCTKGVCDLAGQCTQVLDPGAKCPGEDQCMEGQCSGTGACEFSPKPAGSLCTATAPGTDWDCYTGACDGKGGCTLKVNTGATCFQGKAACTKGVCQSDASCKTVLLDAGTPCSNGCMVNAVCTPAGECKGTPVPGKACYDQCLTDATCSAQGECKGVAMVDQPCYGSSKTTLCQSSTCNSQGNCVKSNKVLGTPCDVGAAGYGEVAGYACGSKAGTCNGAGGCVPAFTDPDGSPCGADDGCAKAHVCKGGKCSPVDPKPNGTPCKYGCASGICTAGGCIAGYGMDFGGGPCDDGNVCTFDYCAGAPLPGFKPQSFLPSAPSGECFTTQNSTACPTGKPPKPTPKCVLEGCPKNECGVTMVCKFSYDGSAGCDNPLGSAGYYAPACETGNPCSNVGCVNGKCYYSPLLYAATCGAFKYCKGMECVAME